MKQIDINNYECPTCKGKKHISEFGVALNRKYGIAGFCKQCKKESKIKYLSNIDNFLSAIVLTSKSCNPKKDFNIDANYLKSIYDLQKGLCAITKIPMTTIRGKGKVITNISIDRLDTKKGYIKGNIQLLCFSSNIMKQNCSNEDIVNFILLAAKNINKGNKS